MTTEQMDEKDAQRQAIPREDPGWTEEADPMPEADWGPIPRYAMLDIWMAVNGSERSQDFERFADQYGYAETWAQLCADVRLLRPESAFSPDLHEWHDKVRAENDVTTMAPEPIEQRLRRAYANGWKEGFERAGLDTRWDR